MKRLPTPKCTIHTIYCFEYLGFKLNIEFIKVKNVPGYSHRVIANGSPIDWLGDHVKPSASTAQYFYDKHAPKSQETTLKHGYNMQTALTPNERVPELMPCNRTD